MAVIKQQEKMSKRVVPYGVLLTRTNPAIRTRTTTHIQQGLREAGINTPQGAMFARDAVKAAWEFAQSLGQPVVVKPLSGSGGAGVSTDISTLPHFEQAWDHARAAGSSAPS